MRWSPLLLALLLAGCAQAPDAPTPTQTGAPIAGGIAPAPTGNVPLAFAGTAQAATVAFDDTFPPDQWCTIQCSGLDHLHDLTAQVPAGVPVHVVATVTGPGNFYAYLTSSKVSYASYFYSFDASGVLLEADILRPADGTVGLALLYEEPDYSALETAPKLHTEVTLRSDPTRLPPGIPVALTLKPGDTVNATGEGVKGLHLLPPTGPALTDTAPAGIRIPDGGAAGTYIAIAYGTAAAQLLGPSQTLQPRSYAYHVGTTHEVPAGQAFTWDQEIPGRPVRVSLRLDCKQVADMGCSGSFRTSGQYTITAPDGAQVFDHASDCNPVCDMTLLMGYYQRGYAGDFLDPHLTPGTYRGSAEVDQGNAMQATIAWTTIE